MSFLNIHVFTDNLLLNNLSLLLVSSFWWLKPLASLCGKKNLEFFTFLLEEISYLIFLLLRHIELCLFRLVPHLFHPFSHLHDHDMLLIMLGPLLWAHNIYLIMKGHRLSRVHLSICYISMLPNIITCTGSILQFLFQKFSAF